MAAPTFYFIGGELDSLVISADAANVTELTNYAQANISRGATHLFQNLAAVRAYMLDPATQARANAAPSDFWLHWWGCNASFNAITNATFMSLVNGAGTPIFRIYRSAGSVLQAQYWSGSAWVNAGATFTPAVNSSVQFDVHVQIGASAKIEVYVSKSLVATISGVNTSAFNFQFAEWNGCNNQGDANSNCVQQICASDTITLDMIVRRRAAPTGASAVNTAWTNTYTEVDEYPTSNADYITGTATGDKETYTSANVALTSGNEIKAVAIAARCRNDGTGVAPTNAKGLLRIGGADYGAAGDFNALGTSFDGRVSIYHTDPSTSAGWTLANFNAGEYGLQAEA